MRRDRLVLAPGIRGFVVVFVTRARRSFFALVTRFWIRFWETDFSSGNARSKSSSLDNTLQTSASVAFRERTR